MAPKRGSTAGYPAEAEAVPVPSRFVPVDSDDVENFATFHVESFVPCERPSLAVDLWPSQQSDLVFEKRLGAGYFGQVWRCKWPGAPTKEQAERPLAVKRVPLSVLRQHNLMEQMGREIDILRRLKHPRIVELHFDFRTEKEVLLGMAFAAGGVLFDKLAKNGKVGYKAAAMYFYETCDALAYMHALTPPIVHRDIKLENILLDGDGHIKLADFGWSNFMETVGLRQTFCGTPDYLAPEMIRGEGHDEKLDMWCMGVLLYELCVGKSPFGSNNQEQTCRNILKLALHFPKGIDADAEACVRALLRIKTTDRLSAKEAMAHAFTTKYSSEARDAEEARAPRASVEVPRLVKEKQRLEGEMLNVLQAKAQTEANLLEATEELTVCEQRLARERRAREAAAEELRQLQAQEEAQLRELEALRARK